MATNKRTMKATPEEVFEVLLDPECYPDWVVGAKAVRGQDKEWPAEGSSFYHRVGVEGVNLKDKTTMLALDAPRHVELTAYARPFGVARVAVRTEPAENGTVVEIFEKPEEGTKMHAIALLVDPFIKLRNVLSLKRLEETVVTRAKKKRAGST